MQVFEQVLLNGWTSSKTPETVIQKVAKECDYERSQNLQVVLESKDMPHPDAVQKLGSHCGECTSFGGNAQFLVLETQFFAFTSIFRHGFFLTPIKNWNYSSMLWSRFTNKLHNIYCFQYPGYPSSLQASLHAFLTSTVDSDFTSSVHPTMISCGDNLPRLMFIGACVGARVGLEGIPKEWIAKTKKGEEIIKLAQELAALRGKIK